MSAHREKKHETEKIDSQISQGNQHVWYRQHGESLSLKSRELAQSFRQERGHFSLCVCVIVEDTVARDILGGCQVVSTHSLAISATITLVRKPMRSSDLNFGAQSGNVAHFVARRLLEGGEKPVRTSRRRRASRGLRSRREWAHRGRARRERGTEIVILFRKYLDILGNWKRRACSFSSISPLPL